METNVKRQIIHFVRLKSGEDLVGEVEFYDEYITIIKPLKIEIETIFEENRQILSLQEYLPQSVIDIRSCNLPHDEVLFVQETRNEFIEQYEYVAEFFYENQNKLREKTTSSLINKVEDVNETAKKVVSILEAMANKKDKPVH